MRREQGRLRRTSSNWPRIGWPNSSPRCTRCRSSSYRRGHHSGRKRRRCPKRCRPTRPCSDPSCRDSTIHRSPRRKRSFRRCKLGRRSRHSSSSPVQPNHSPSIGRRCRSRRSRHTSRFRRRSYCCNSSLGLRIGCPDSMAAQEPRSRCRGCCRCTSRSGCCRRLRPSSPRSRLCRDPRRSRRFHRCIGSARRCTRPCSDSSHNRAGQGRRRLRRRRCCRYHRQGRRSFRPEPCRCC